MRSPRAIDIANELAELARSRMREVSKWKIGKFDHSLSLSVSRLSSAY